MSALIVMAVLLAVAGAWGQSPKDETDASEKKVKELQKERIAVLESAAESSMRLVEIGRLEVSEAMEDRLALLQAQLDAAESRDERISLYQKTVDALKDCEEVAKAKKMAALGTEVSVLRIRARRLGVEIQLERARVEALK
jgi:hypothetical protein